MGAKKNQQQQLNSLLDQAWRINKGMEYREGGRFIKGEGIVLRIYVCRVNYAP